MTHCHFDSCHRYFYPPTRVLGLVCLSSHAEEMTGKGTNKTKLLKGSTFFSGVRDEVRFPTPLRVFLIQYCADNTPYRLALSTKRACWKLVWVTIAVSSTWHPVTSFLDATESTDTAINSIEGVLRPRLWSFQGWISHTFADLLYDMSAWTVKYNEFSLESELRFGYLAGKTGRLSIC